MSDISLDYFVVSETKLDSSFPSAQFHINGYEVRARRDRDKSGGGLIEFVRKGFISKRLKKLEPKCSEVICSEFTVSNKKWICFSVYRPPTQNNLECFFNELTTSLSQASVMCDNFIVMGDFNIDLNLPSHEHDKLEEFCNLFDLSNLIKSNTCFTKTHSSKTDLILTNNSNSFQKSGTTETGLSDFHKLISTFFKSHFSRLSPKAIYYRNYKNFDESKFIEDLIYTDFSLQSDDPNENYSFLTREFSHLRKKFIRGNHAPFMNKELRKAIYTRSRLRNKFCKSPSKENEALYKNNEINAYL